MSENQVSLSDYFKISQNHIKESYIRYTALILSAIQCVLFSIVLSSINPNTLLSWYDNNHLKRMTLIAISGLGVLFWKILARTGLLNPKQLLAIIFIAHFIFCYNFIYPQILLETNKRIIFPFSKLMIHVNAFILISYSLVSSLYFTAIDFYVKTIPQYTHSRGLFSFLKSNILEIAADSKKALSHYIKIITLILVCYFCFIHNISNLILPFFRIAIFYRSIKEVILYVLVLGINTTVFTAACKLIDCLVVFNISFRPDDLTLDDTDVLEYQKVTVSYKKKEIKFKTSPKMAKVIESSIKKDINNLKNILEMLDQSKKDLNSKIFVSVPQVNKGYTKKYKAYHLIDVLISRICFHVRLFLLSEKFHFASNILAEKLEFVLFVKEQENVVITCPSIQSLLYEIVTDTKDVSEKMDVSLLTDKLLNIHDKIH